MNLSQSILSDMAVHEGIYCVFMDGRVFNKKLDRFMAQNTHTQGYKMVNIHGRLRYVHRLVAECFLPRSEGKDVVDHLDGDVSNNHVDNLEWVTQLENVERSQAVDYKFINPEGDILSGNNVNKLCREFGLQSSHMHKVLSGERKSHKGWRKH